jgi:hypothetical protein
VEKKRPAALVEVLNGFPTVQPLRLMFQDEARFGRISSTRTCWAKKPLRPLVKAMLTHEYTYAYSAVSPQDGRLDSLVLPYVNGQCMHLFLTEIAQRYPTENLVMVLDGAGWPKSGAFELPANLRLLFLPPYAPELNPQEHVWDELREKFFHNRTFDSIEALEDQLVDGLQTLEADLPRVRSIVAWDWIINAISNAK